MYNLTRDAFDLADKYRTPVLVLADAILGQMMEAVAIDRAPLEVPMPHSWGTRGMGKGKRKIVNSLYIQPDALEEVNNRLAEKYAQMAREDVRWEEQNTDDAEILLVAFGSGARIAQTAAEMLTAQGIKTGLFRPITLYPFPSEQLLTAARKAKQVMVFEMNKGQMVEDVRLAVQCERKVNFYGRTGGVVPTPEDLVEATLESLKNQV
jgi:2-oxoglutarate ferredoxin oxidoreductase subunit alpha